MQDVVQQTVWALQKKRVLSKHDRLEEGKVVFRHPGH